ncbi:MAG: hypothetical protein AAF412_06225 [Pseudomonadota bacterium]
MKLLSHKTPVCLLLRVTMLVVVLLVAQPISTAHAESLREVAERVARQNDAKLVSAREVTDRDGRKVYVIRILTRDGVVRTIRVPARDRHKLNSQFSLLQASGGWHFNIDSSETGFVITKDHPLVDSQFGYATQGAWV